VKDLKDYIVVLDGVVPEYVADLILDEYRNCADWKYPTIQNGTDLSVRNCQTIGLSLADNVIKNPEVRKNIDKSMFHCASQAIMEYARRFPSCAVVKDSGYDLLKYDTGCLYAEHTDSYNDIPREVSCSFALNDDYAGGEFAFFGRKEFYKLKKGSCIMFPANFMYPHEVMPVTSGVRYSVVTWFV
jgi:hypothetical protein